jgi:murein DD-endopeptidase MepM/ murein hydrolase activator NlpD
MSHVHWVILFVSTSLFSVIFFLISDIAEATRAKTIGDGNLLSSYSQSSIKMVNLPLDVPDYLMEKTPIGKVLKAPNLKWKTLSVQKGDTLFKIFSRLKIDPKQLHQLLKLGKPTATLNLISPGDELKFLIVDGKLNELIYEVNDHKSLHITRNDNGFKARTLDKSLNKRIAHATAVIDSNLFMAAQKAGIPGSLTMELAKIFNFDIDFMLDVKKGDSFSIIYEEYYADGEKISYGDILAAEFVNNGTTYRAVRYTDNHGDTSYYTPDGKNTRKTFLRTPVDFTRISSRFGKRFHPILNRMRNHDGVDYAAPLGTPIKAAGDGRIAFIGRKGGYGNTILIQHDKKYSTLYAHMKQFKRGIKRGSWVKQGDVIGYVGQTGLATGPHLHYEFRINGEHHNPLTVKLPGSKPITSVQLTNFKLNTQGYLTLLDTLDKTRLASR